LKGKPILKESVKNKSGIIAEFKRQSPSKGIINDSVSAFGCDFSL
jgi:indole-3-glycerol phosphate synthase